MQKNIAVIFGGRSNENEISVITGTLVCSTLKKAGYSVIPVYINADGTAYSDERLERLNFYSSPNYKKIKRAVFSDGQILFLNEKRKIKGAKSIYCAVNCCHGGLGENGALSGLMQLCNVPLASAGIAESAVLSDKYLTKLFARALGVKTAPYKLIRRGYSQDDLKKIKYPCVVKPCNLGSSIAVCKVNDAEELIFAIETAFAYDDAVIIEKYLEGYREINCACYMASQGIKTGEVEEVLSSGEVLSYDDKYCGCGRRILPAELSPNDEEKIKNTTKKLYSALNMRGIVRFDFLLYGDGLYLCEGNAVPGSLSNYLISSSAQEFADILKDLIDFAVAEFEKEKGNRIAFTGLLNNFISSNACKLK